LKKPMKQEPGVLKILDVGGYLAGPTVSTFLGDLGAEVIKVERPGKGDPGRQYGPIGEGEEAQTYQWLVEGRNKRSVTLDFREPKGHQLFSRLVEWADILVENYRPGAMDGWGVGYKDMAAINPRLVYVSVSGFGQDGPYRDRPGFDYVACAVGGLTFSTGYADRPPVLPAFAVADYLGGSFGAIGALEAVRRRDAAGSDGLGEWIDLALYEPILRFSTPMVSAYKALGVVPERQAGMPVEPRPQHPRFIAFVYQTRDEHWVSVSPVQVNDASHGRFIEAIKRTDLLSDPRYATAKEAQTNYLDFDRIVRDWVAARSRQEVIDVLVDAEIPFAPVNGPEEICSDPHLTERSLVDIPDNRGIPITMQRPIPKFTRRPNDLRWAAETLGESNDDIFLGLLKISPDEYEQLKCDGVI
jgi:crotonobetainyl-CoA:carnitine CoA-transferase CaiB-like acyl-CoA transferase